MSVFALLNITSPSFQFYETKYLVPLINDNTDNVTITELAGAQDIKFIFVNKAFWEVDIDFTFDISNGKITSLAGPFFENDRLVIPYKK